MYVVDFSRSHARIDFPRPSLIFQSLKNSRLLHLPIDGSLLMSQLAVNTGILTKSRLARCSYSLDAPNLYAHYLKENKTKGSGES